MNSANPEVCILNKLLGRVAEDGFHIGANKGCGVASIELATVDHSGAGSQQKLQPFLEQSIFLFCTFAIGNVLGNA